MAGNHGLDDLDIPARIVSCEALRLLCMRENDTTRLENAEQAYRELLKELTLERDPISWATAQNHFGTVLLTRGIANGYSAAALVEAVVAFRSALQVRTLIAAPMIG